MFDAIVIGGGIVGASLAYHLVSVGAKTVLFDRRDPGQATAAGAGILSPETSSASDTWFNFAVEAVAYYTPLLAQLQAEQGGESGYAVCGILEVAVSDDELEPYKAAKEIVLGRQKRRGLPAPSDLVAVSPAEAQAMFPPLTAVQKALYYRGAARIDGRLFCNALLAAAISKGLDFRPASVEQLVLDGDRVAGVVAGGETLKAGQVAIAGGAWSAAFGAQLGVEIPVEPQRGQIVHLELPNADTAAWPIVHPFQGHYLVAWPGGRVVVGATRETGSGFAPWATAAGVRAVLDEALRVAPGLAAGRIVDIRVGLRPHTPDRLPVLGRVPGRRGVFLATGHGPTGLQLGPYSGKLIADLMLEQSIAVDLAPFYISRFG